MKPETQALKVVSRFGDISRMAEATGIDEAAIKSWVRRGTIPQKHWANILACRGAAPLLTIHDFLHDLIEQLGAGIFVPLSNTTSGNAPASSAMPA